VTDFRAYAAEEVLRDGGSIHVRAIRADDKARLLEHFNSLSPRSVHLRFFGAKRRLTDTELVRFTELDFVRDVGLLATLRNGDSERIIAVGRYMSTAAGRAEVAFAVADEHQGRGVGTVLLEHLASIARANGIREFEADVLGENNQMLSVFRKSGFVVQRSIDAGVIHFSFPTDETEEFLRASLDRDMRASAESVRHFLRPASVAVIGATDRADSVGGALLRNLRAAGFAGDLYPVHPHRAEIEGLAAYPDIAAVGRAVELAVIAVPTAAVREVVDQCARAGVRAVVVLSSGFAEVSAEGRRAEEELTRLVRRSGMRMVGPNCLGVLNNDPEVRLNATFAPATPLPGNVGMLAQSGALGLALLDHAQSLGLALSSFASVGNKADVSGNDLLSYWNTDPRTAVIALYLESFGNPRRFARIAPRVAEGKPIVAVKAGRTGAARHGVMGRVGALANVDGAVEALFRQAGVIRTETIGDLFGVLALLSTQPLPAGPRVGVVTNARGPGILFAEACEARSLSLPQFDPGTARPLRDAIGAAPEIGNPLELGPFATPEGYERAIGIVGADACVDAVVAIHIPGLATSNQEIGAAIARGAAAVPAEKPVLVVFISARGIPEELFGGGRGRLPAYAFPENAAIALGAAEGYARWRQRPRGEEFELDRTAVSAIRAVIDRARSEAPGWLEPRDFATVMRAAGIPIAEPVVAVPEDAGELAETLGYPLVAKAVAEGLESRSEAGCVLLDLGTKRAVERAVRTLRRRVAKRGLELDAVLLQRQFRGGIEAVAGVTTDALFGPLVVCGLGGVLTEVARDFALRLTPLTDIDATEMLASLRSAPLLQGYRGIGPADAAALASILLRLSALVDVAPELRELDLDPIAVLGPGEGAVVLDGRLRL
jgi:acyl-CoA synthetase (NDP forming)/GNAT superfamily N-acetyltransferase